MQKKPIIISCVLVISIIFSGLALADSQRSGHRQGFGSKQHHQGGILQMLAAYQQKNLRLQVLSEMTGQPEEALQLKLKDQRLRSVMQEFNIDRQAFRDALKAKERAQIKQAVADGSITPEQENKILTKMENRTKRRELMSRLIEKGIEDGTITRDEARMLTHKGR
jgi:hypothetical protein